MVIANEVKAQSIAVILADLWRRWCQSRNGTAELAACGPEARQIADDLGLSPGELQVIAAKRPDAADLLTNRLAELHLDAARTEDANGPVLRDLQRVCTLCGSKTRCAGDLAAHASNDWQTYCPNAPTLNALVAQSDQDKAIARLMRRQTHRLNSLRSS